MALVRAQWVTESSCFPGGPEDGARHPSVTKPTRLQRRPACARLSLRACQSLPWPLVPVNTLSCYRPASSHALLLFISIYVQLGGLPHLESEIVLFN